MRVLNKLADIKSTEESVDDIGPLQSQGHPTIENMRHSAQMIQRSMPSMMPRLQLDQIPMLPGFHQFRGFK